MGLQILSLIFAGLVALLMFAPAARAEPFAAEAQPLLATFCYDCHNMQKAKGDLDLSRFKDAGKAANSPDVWEGVIQRVAAGEMPPKKSKQMSAAEKDRLVAAIKALPKPTLNCDDIANDATQRNYRGHVMSRRLTRAEYNNTIRDLLGLDLRPGDDLPADGAGGEGFDTTGDALFTSPIHVEKYLDAAEHALDALLGDTKPAEERFGHDAVRAARRQVLTARPEGKTPPREAARKVIADFARRAFRRPVEPAEVERYLKLFDRAAARGDSFNYSIKFALQAVLISPNFLFLVEPEGEKDGIHPLGDFPLASRLSYFLWASMPDEELLSLAAQKKLQDENVLRQQVRRMLKDPRSRGTAERFALQWLELTAIGEASRPDAARYPQFNDKFAAAMKDEAVLLVDRIFREDRPITQLLDADYTFVNDDLARLYNLPGVSGPEMRLVELKDRNRGGILGLAAVHVATSYPLRTSPVLRGKWVLQNVLGSKVPPPPPNVPQLPEDDKHATKDLPFRKQLELHRQNPDCAGCHNRLDPPGFGLENFDAIGRWREKDAAGVAIDASGEFSSGETFSGPAELKQLLLKRKAEFEENFCRKLLGYALGRDLRAKGRRPGQFDQCVVDDCMKALAANGERSQAIFETIVLSKPFRYRYTKK